MNVAQGEEGTVFNIYTIRTSLQDSVVAQALDSAFPTQWWGQGGSHLIKKGTYCLLKCVLYKSSTVEEGEHWGNWYKKWAAYTIQL